MKNIKLAAAVLAAVSAIAGNAHAAGFQLTEQSALALGRAYAGVGVDGTDISGVYYNPATMTLHKGTKVQLGAVGVGLNLDYADDRGSEYDANGRSKPEVVPHGFFLHQINDSTWFGMGITVPFGMGTEYDDNWANAERGISANIITVDFNPNVAWKVNEKFSIGAGISLQYAQADLKKRGYVADMDASGNVTAVHPYNSEIDADSTAWGWNVGLMWTPVENVRVGLSYRSKITHDAEGDLKIDGMPNTITMPDRKGGTTNVPMGMMNGTLDGFATVTAPAWAMANVAWDVNDWLSLYGTFRWADWSSFDKLEIEGTSPIPNVPAGSTVENNWKDTYLFSLGSDIRVNDVWTLRGGIAYETSPIKNPEYRTAIIPDADRWWFAVGSSFKWTEQFQTDISFAHLHGVGERNLYSGENGSGEKVGRFRKLDAYLLGVQMQYTF